MSKHTPGPWTVERYGDGDALVIHSDDIMRVCFMATPGSRGENEEIESNARLIAAAPELLEALEKLIEEVEERGYRKPSVRALIRKAKGEA